MIRHGDAEEVPRLLEHAREAMILRTRHGIAARMVVRENDVRRAAADCRLIDLARVHECIRERPHGHICDHQHLILRRERQHEKVFPFLGSKTRAQQRRNILCRAYARAGLCRALRTPSKFKRGKHRRRLCHANARDPCELRTGHR